MWFQGIVIFNLNWKFIIKNYSYSGVENLNIISIQVEGQCNRCQMVCIDQTTGEKTVEPLRTLAEEFNGKLKFGIYLTRKNSDDSILKIGDKLIYD